MKRIMTTKLKDCEAIVLVKIDDGSEIYWLASVHNTEWVGNPVIWTDTQAMRSPEAAAYRAKRWLQGG